MTSRIILQVVCMVALFVSSALANPDSLQVVGGDLRIMGNGNGLVFPDGSIQYTATMQGPTGPVGPTGPAGPAGPACQVTLESICAAISAGGMELPLFCTGNSPLIGSWYGTNLGQSHSTVVLTFVDNSTFLLAEDGNSSLDPSGSDGMERGTYTWTTTTFTPLVLVDTNGEWGFSSDSGTAVPYSVSNNILTVGSGDETVSLTKILPDPSNPLIGSWYGTNLGQAQSTAVLTFVDNSTFLLAEDGNSSLDPSGRDGMERGTYTRTATTFTPSVSVDTNGGWGFSSDPGAVTIFPYSISNNILNIAGSICTKVQ